MLEKLHFSVFLPHNSLETSLATLLINQKGGIPCSDNCVINVLPLSLPAPETWGEPVL